MIETVPTAGEPPDKRATVSTAQVSQALGVSVSTIKRWVDDGVLPGCKTAGGHRRLFLADVLRLLRDGDFPNVDLSLLGVGPSDRGAARFDHATELHDAMLAGDRRSIRALLLAAFQSGQSIPELADRTIAPAMVRVGDAWQKGRIDVAHEHRGTQMCIEALHELRTRLEERSHAAKRPIAVGGAVEQDHSVLPSLLAQMTLIECGWNAINLGPHTPISTMLDALEQFRPQLLWISVSHLDDVDAFCRDLASLVRSAKRENAAVAIGGRALTPEIRLRVAPSIYGESLSQLAALANALNPSPLPPKRGRPRKRDR